MKSVWNYLRSAAGGCRVILKRKTAIWIQSDSAGSSVYIGKTIAAANTREEIKWKPALAVGPVPYIPSIQSPTIP